MAFSPETFEQIIHVKTVEDSRYDSALPHAIAKIEPTGVDTIPFFIAVGLVLRSVIFKLHYEMKSNSISLSYTMYN